MGDDQELTKASSQFSTLNVNALEFVPSFACPKTIDDPPPGKPVIETPENNGNGKLPIDYFLSM
jgi:Ataxin-2 C-terminal region